jgi:hypothetical protein
VKLRLVSDPLKVAVKGKAKKKKKNGPGKNSRKRARRLGAGSKVLQNGMGNRGWSKCGAKGRSMGNGNYCTR